MAHVVIVPESGQTNLLLALVTECFAQQLQRIANTLTPYSVAATLKLHTGGLHRGLAVCLQCHAKTHRPHGLAWHSAAWPRNPSNGHGKLCAGMFQSAAGHLSGRLATDGTKRGKRFGLHSKHLFFSTVRIRDKAAFVPLA